jgi:hypothetical protein
LRILHVGFDVILGSADGRATHATEPTTLFLTISVSANASSSLTAPVSTPNPTTVSLDDAVAEGSAARPIVQSNTNESIQPTAATASLSPSSQTGDLRIEVSTSVEPVADSQAEMSRTLYSAEEAMDMIKTWSSAVDVVKQVMDLVSPIVNVCLRSVLPVLR